jgi:hypothetical protein
MSAGQQYCVVSSQDDLLIAYRKNGKNVREWMNSSFDQ